LTNTKKLHLEALNLHVNTSSKKVTFLLNGCTCLWKYLSAKRVFMFFKYFSYW